MIRRLSESKLSLEARTPYRAALAAALVVLGMAWSPGAASAAAFELTGHFGGILPPTPPPSQPSEFPEEEQLGGVGGMAVNVSGAGGVKAGTLYVAKRGGTLGDFTLRIAMYEPAGDGLKFVERWDVFPTEKPYERCGPLLPTQCAPKPTAGRGSVDVEVDQGTGDVYVFNVENLGTGEPTVTVFKPDGSEVLARFAEYAPSHVTTVSTPDLVHESPYQGGMAIAEDGTVYLFDLNEFENFYHRLMAFREATPGDPSTYEYVEGGDLGGGFLFETEYPTMPEPGPAGSIYVAGYEGTYIQKYEPGGPATPVCEFTFAKGGITAMTVDPQGGEAFFFSGKDKLIHRLGPCSGGKFTDLGTIAVSPQRDDLYALAFDPDRELPPTGRGAGVLYGGAPGAKPTTGKGEPGMGALGYIFAPVPELKPVVESEAISAVGPTSARLEAEINPKGPQTTYAFQYIAEATYLEDGEEFGAGTLEAPPVPAALGGGTLPLHAAALASGLLPDTAYRYRAIATSNCSPTEPEKVCEGIGEAESFHTYPVQVAGPPDGRAYELVSPPQKHGGQVLPADPGQTSCIPSECKPGMGYTHFPMQSAPGGDAVVYEGTPFGEEGALIENSYLARRSASGWVSANLTPPLLASGGDRGYLVFNPELTEGLLKQVRPSLSPEAPPDFNNFYRQPSASPTTLTPLLTNSNACIHRAPLNGAGTLQPTYAGGSEDLSRLFLSVNDELLSCEGGPPNEETNLYEASGGALRQVNLAPGSDAPLPGAVFGSGKLLESGGTNNKVAVLSHAISSDGSRVFWTGKDGKTYVRLNGSETLEVPGPGSCKASLVLALRTCFLSASEDGSQVLLSNGQLYELNEEAGAYEPTTDLSAGKGGFEGIAGQSEDLSHVYFLDTEVLSGEEENDQGDKAQAGKHNLYAWSKGATSFVATLLAGDNSSPGDWQAAPVVRTAEASPAGRYLAFASTAPLTGFDNVGPCQFLDEKYLDIPCLEVFLFDSATGSLSCPSCNPTGAPPLGVSTLRLIRNVPGSMPQPRYLTDAGRLYFDSRDSLSYLDTNAGVEDVYQYEPQGVGGCGREGGCVGLVSAGRGPVDSNLLAIDATGENVFFTSRDRLVAADKDDLIDLYDARVDGGFPEPPPPASCLGETCQAPTEVPAGPSAASQGSLGKQNYVAPRCKKGRVRRGERCAKQKPKHKHKAKQAKRKGGSK